MKVNISKLLVLLLLISLFGGVPAHAQTGTALYNRGAEVTLYEEIMYYNSHAYISVTDLAGIDLDYYFSGGELQVGNGENILLAYPETSVVVLNGASLLYKSPLVASDDVYYISLDLIAMVFSGVYEQTDGAVYLWTDSCEFDVLRGVVSLPDGICAPEGGIDVCVFAGRPDKDGETIAPSGGSYAGSGGISLPPAGGSSDSFPSAGYSGSEKPSLYTSIYTSPDSSQGYEYVVKADVTIDAGKSCAEFSLNAPACELDGTYIGYFSENADYPGGYVKKYYRGGHYRFILNRPLAAINGRITLPAAAEEDTVYTVCAKSGDSYAYTGTIEKGAAFGEYTLKVAENNAYSISVIFEDGKYKRMINTLSAQVGTETFAAADIAAAPSPALGVTLKTPGGAALAEEVTAEIVLQGAQSPYFYLDRRTAVIPAGAAETTAVLYDDTDCGEVICCYTLKDEHEGLYSFGNYSSSGNSCFVKNAEIMDLSETSSITAELLGASYINADISLPDGETAETDIYAGIYHTVFSENSPDAAPVLLSETTNLDGDEAIAEAVRLATSAAELDAIIRAHADAIPTAVHYLSLQRAAQAAVCHKLLTDSTQIRSVAELSTLIAAYCLEMKPSTGSSGGGGGHGNASSALLISAGETSGSRRLKLPDERDVLFSVSISNITGTDKYYPYTYYAGDGKISVFRANAARLPAETENLAFTLMRKYNVSGHVTTDIGCVGDRVYAVYQADSSARDTVESAIFRATGSVDENYDYNIAVPEELSDYIICLRHRGRSAYYAASGSTAEISEAEVVNITSDVTGLGITYNGCNPSLPFVLSPNRDEYGVVRSLFLKNISDYEKNSVTVCAAFYDGDGRLLKTQVESYKAIDAHGGFTVIKLDSSDAENAVRVKAFVWSWGLTPLSEAILLDDFGRTS